MQCEKHFSILASLAVLWCIKFHIQSVCLNSEVACKRRAGNTEKKGRNPLPYGVKLAGEIWYQFFHLPDAVVTLPFVAWPSCFSPFTQCWKGALCSRDAINDEMLPGCGGRPRNHSPQLRLSCQTAEQGSQMGTFASVWGIQSLVDHV